MEYLGLGNSVECSEAFHQVVDGTKGKIDLIGVGFENFGHLKIGLENLLAVEDCKFEVLVFPAVKMAKS